MDYIYIFEALEGLTSGLVMTAAAEYAFAATPPGMIATVQALIHIGHLAFGISSYHR